VVAVEGDTVTVSTQQGEVKVKANGARVQKMVEAPLSDLREGERVMVVGQQGSDGSFTASSIQVVPAGGNPGFGGTNQSAGGGNQGPGGGAPAKQ
jgi:hypothetical protein